MLLAWILLTLQGPAPAEPAVVPLGWDDFPVFVWREKYAGKPLPEELIEPFGGTLLMREEPSDWLRAKGHAYLIFNAAGRSPLHLDADAAWNDRVERWIGTQDEKLLVREPCLNDPQVRARLFATVEATLKARDGDHGLGLSLGDEVSLTPNGSPFDLCRCPHCEALWREHARKNALPERAPLTDEVRLALVEDDYSLLGAWMERRRFDQRGVLGLLGELLNWHSDPKFEYGLLGCTGQTVFGGVALDWFPAQLDFIECYPVRDAREQVETLPILWERWPEPMGAPLRPRSLTTLFVEGESAAGLSWLVWEHWVRGGDGIVLWKDSQLETLPPPHRARLVNALAAARSIQHRTGSKPSPRPSTIAVLHDADSDAVGFMKDSLLDGATWPRRTASHQDEHGTRGRKLRSWIRLFQDSGCSIGSLPFEVPFPDHHSLFSFFPVLIAPDLLVIDEAQILQLERHLQDGGLLVVDGAIGWVNRRGRPHERDVLERLRSVAPARVIQAPSVVADYLTTRWEASTRENAGRFVQGLLERVSRPADVEGSGPRLEGDAGRFPWLRGRFRWDDKHVYAWLPNCPTAEDRSRLSNIELELTVPAGFELEWLHPVDGKNLEAGDAAVFVLRRSDEPDRR